MATVYVKPRDGGRVRQPERNSRVMPEAGDTVPRNTYYERLIIGGDVVICEAPAKPKPATPAAAPAPEATPAAPAEPPPAEPSPMPPLASMPSPRSS